MKSDIVNEQEQAMLLLIATAKNAETLLATAGMANVLSASKSAEFYQGLRDLRDAIKTAEIASKQIR